MSTDPVFASLSRVTLQAERLRHSILAALLAAVGLFAFVALQLDLSFVTRITHGTAPRLAPIVPLVAAAYELFMRRLATRAIAEGRQPSTTARYANAFLETTIPSALIVVASGWAPAYAAVLSPPSLVYFIFIALSGLRLDFKLSVFTGACAAVQFLALAAWADASIDATVEPILVASMSWVGRAGIMMITSVVTGLVGLRVRRAVEQSVRVVDLFGQQVSAAVVEKLLSQPEIASENRHVCVMFLDIRDFTTFSEKRRPEEVVAYLNALWSFMVDVVNAHGGIINKFLGDGFMATFGAPVSAGDDCRNAVRAAKEILARVHEESARGTIPPTRVGIGLHAGEAVTGNIGGRQRKEYSVIGDVVNLASRIESLNKPHTAQLLVSDEVKRRAPEETATATSLGPITVKGREQPVEVFKLA